MSNPPYFINSLLPPTQHRARTRHTEQLTFDELMTHSIRLLNQAGTLAVILPVQEGNDFKDLASKNRLYVKRQLAFYSRKEKPQERWLLEFGFEQTKPKEEKLILYGSGDLKSSDYINPYQRFLPLIMKWITRERPKIDRIACPWLIKRFVDKEAEIDFMCRSNKSLKNLENSTRLPSICPMLNTLITEIDAHLIISLKNTNSKIRLCQSSLRSFAVQTLIDMIWPARRQAYGQSRRGFRITLPMTRNCWSEV